MAQKTDGAIARNPEETRSKVNAWIFTVGTIAIFLILTILAVKGIG